MVLLSAQSMDVAGIARVAFTSEDHARDVIHNFNADGFDSLYPRYRGGRPPKFTLPQRREIKKLAKRSRPNTACLSRPGACPSWQTSWSPQGGRRRGHLQCGNRAHVPADLRRVSLLPHGRWSPRRLG